MTIADAKTAPPVRRAALPHPPLAQETRTHVDTACAAFHLSRKPRTLRAWATGELPAPISPKRINRRLAWEVDSIRRLLEGGDA